MEKIIIKCDKCKKNVLNKDSTYYEILETCSPNWEETEHFQRQQKNFQICKKCLEKFLK